LLRVDPPDLGLWPTLVRLFGLWRVQWRLAVVGLACSLTYTLLSTAIPILVQQAIDHAIVTQDRPLAAYLAAIVALATLRAAVNRCRRYTTAQVGLRIEAQMRALLYRAYLHFPRSFYDRHATGQVLSRATNDLYPIRNFMSGGLVQGSQSVMMILATAIVLLLVDARLALYMAVAMPPLTFVAFHFARRVSPVSRAVQQRKADVTESADEAVVGIEVIKSFGREDQIRDTFATRAEAVRSTVLRQAQIESRHLPALYYLPSLSIAAVVLLGGNQVIAGELSIGQFVLFQTLLLQAAGPLESVGWIVDLAQRAVAAARRCFGWLDGVEQLPDPERPRTVADGPLDVRLDRVGFSYDGGTVVLRELNLTIEAGEIVAVCGSTGAGKTSLLNLVPRFYDPSAGRVLVGGVDLREVRIAELRRAVALVTQRPVLFSASLADNLIAGREDADWDQVLASCTTAGVDALVRRLPDGYQTLIGERGVNLSGGERQRVALARALVRGSRVVVLDDPLSAVDISTERQLIARLRPALAGRTVLLAAQRLTTVRLADRAVVLEDGMIVESGSPAELLRAQGMFAKLFGEERAAA
jgi:ABC-type multidrug transport system fused ATPase/permease subunit